MPVSITDLISKAVSASAGSAQIPANVKNTVLSGLQNSILSSLTQTAAKPSGLEQLTNLFTGKANAASSPVTSLATSIFTKNILSKLNLGSNVNSGLSALIPLAVSNLSGLIKDQDGDGDVDLNDILITLKGGNRGGSLLGAATSILGGILGKK